MRGELEKTSEALWGSLSASLNALAVLKAAPLTSHGDLKNFARQLSLELREPLIRESFEDAERLHANFYHGFLDEESVHKLSQKVEAAVRKLIILVESELRKRGGKVF